MAGPVPAIHVLLSFGLQDVDARDKRGHDGLWQRQRLAFYFLQWMFAGVIRVCRETRSPNVEIFSPSESATRLYCGCNAAGARRARKIQGKDLRQMRERKRELSADELDHVSGGSKIEPIPTAPPPPEPIPPA